MTAAVSPFTRLACWRYGLMGLPLAFVALPLYVVLPNHYAREFGVPLAALGALLLAARLFDALTDPLLGRWIDTLFGRSSLTVWRHAVVAAAVLSFGLAALLFPPLTTGAALMWWAGTALVVTYAAYSFLTIAHQSWAARHGGDEAQRSRLAVTREALGLVGVLVASVLPTWLGLPATWTAFVLAMGLALWAWLASPAPQTLRSTPVKRSVPVSLASPLRNPAFRRLLLVFSLNGVASAVPATLVLFFVQDRLQAPLALQPAFLGVYFACAALSMPVWLRVVTRLGLLRTWLAGMVLAMAVFLGAMLLGAGDAMPFLVICALSGVALGTDLALPSAVLTGVIQAAGEDHQAEGAYLGWWNFATKLNLALAAGLALPLLGWFGYTPGEQDPAALRALSTAYCLLPCALKACAALCLYGSLIRKTP